MSSADEFCNCPGAWVEPVRDLLRHSRLDPRRFAPDYRGEVFASCGRLFDPFLAFDALAPSWSSKNLIFLKSALDALSSIFGCLPASAPGAIKNSPFSGNQTP